MRNATAHSHTENQTNRHSLQNLMRYVATNWGHRGLTIGRLNKIIYLAEYLSLEKRGRRMSDAEWIFDDRGPYAETIRALAIRESGFTVKAGVNEYSAPVEFVCYDGSDSAALEPIDATILDLASERAFNLPWPVFLAEIYDSAPVRIAERGDRIVFSLTPGSRAAA